MELLKTALQDGDIDRIKAALEGLKLEPESGRFEDWFRDVICPAMPDDSPAEFCRLDEQSDTARCVVRTQDYVYLFGFQCDGPAEDAMKRISEKRTAYWYKADPRMLYVICGSYDSGEGRIVDWKVQMVAAGLGAPPYLPHEYCTNSYEF